MGSDAPAVLLLHGFGTSAARTWGDNGWIDLVGDMGRTVIAPDLLGHGSAPKPHDPAAYAQLGPRIAAELPEDGQPVDAVGFSMGARILLELAIEDASRFRRLVIAGAGANLLRKGESTLVRRALLGEADLSNPVARYFASLADDPEADALALAALLTFFLVHALYIFLRHVFHFLAFTLSRHTIPVLRILTHFSLSLWIYEAFT